MPNKFDARLKKITQLFEKVNGKKFCSIMINELDSEFTSLSIGDEKFILPKDKDPMVFVKDYERKNKILFTKSNSITVIITNYSGK